MQTERKVFEKLFTPDKVELESQKVELALIDDINFAYNTLNKTIEELSSFKNLSLSALDNYKSAVAKALIASDTVLSLSQKLTVSAKEFGLDLPEKYINIQKSAQLAPKQLKSIFDSINKAKSIL